MKISSIISSLNLNKSVGSNSLSTNTLELLQDEISYHLSGVYNIFLFMGAFPSVLKTVKVLPVYKKDSNLDCNSYRPISLLTNIDEKNRRTGI